MPRKAPTKQLIYLSHRLCLYACYLLMPKSTFFVLHETITRASLITILCKAYLYISPHWHRPMLVLLGLPSLLVAHSLMLAHIFFSKPSFLHLGLPFISQNYYLVENMFLSYLDNSLFTTSKRQCATPFNVIESFLNSEVYAILNCCFLSGTYVLREYTISLNHTTTHFSLFARKQKDNVPLYLML